MLKSERKGGKYMFFAMILWAMMPIMIKSSQYFFPPLFFASISTLLGGFLALGVLLSRDQIKELTCTKRLCRICWPVQA